MEFCLTRPPPTRRSTDTSLGSRKKIKLQQSDMVVKVKDSISAKFLLLVSIISIWREIRNSHKRHRWYVKFFNVCDPIIDTFGIYFHNDQSSIRRIMVAQIWLKLSIFPTFGSYPYFAFLPWLQILNIKQLFKHFMTYSHWLSTYDLKHLNCREWFILTQYFRPF